MHETTRYRGARRALRSILVRSLAAAAVLLAVGPFWSRDALLQQALDAGASSFNRVYAAPSQDAIAVVLVEDDDLDRLGLSWPFAYARWAQVLQRLGCARVKLIFLDLLFSRDDDFTRADGGPSLAQMDAKLTGGGFDGSDCPGMTAAPGAVPVYYGYVDRPEKWLGGLVPAARKLPLRWPAPEGDYPLIVQDGATHGHSAAYALYRQLCDGPGAARPPGCATPWRGDDLSQRMVPRWTMRTPAGQARWQAVDPVCNDPQPEGAWSAVKDWVVQFRDGPAVNQHCRPFLTLSLGQLLSEFDGSMARALAGRVVLVGASLSGADDLLRVPTHGQLPGVFLHATALENLLSMGAAFDRIDESALRATVIALIVGMSALLWKLERWSGAVDALSPAAWIGLGGLVFVLCVLLMRQALRFPPGLIPGAAVAMTLGLLVGELGADGWLYKGIRSLDPERD